MIKDLVKKSLHGIGYYNVRRRFRSSNAKRLLILMYHHLFDDNSQTDNSGLWSGQTNRSQFEAHMQAIGRRFRVVSVESAADEIRYDGCLREDSIAITFDDGYASVYEIAFWMRFCKTR